MRKRRIGERVLSPRIPESARQTKITVRDFCESLAEFSEEYLRGALTFTCDGTSDGYIVACSYQCSYAIRMAVEHGAPDKSVQISARVADGKFSLHIVIKDDVELEALAQIARALRRAGFAVTPYTYGLMAETKIERDKLLKIYAKSRKTFIQDLYTIFFM